MRQTCYAFIKPPNIEKEYGIVSSLWKFLCSGVLSPVLWVFLIALPLQAGPVQSEAASPPSGAKAKSADPYSNIFPEVVAKVGGDPVYGRELERAIRDELIQIGSPKWESLREEYRGQLVYSSITALVNTKLIYKEAVANGIGVSDAEVQDEYLKVTQMFKNEEDMNAYLKDRHFDRTSVIEELHKNLVINKFIDGAIKSRITVAPKELSDYYTSHQNEFKHPDIVRMSQILIEATAAPESDAKAKQQADAILERINKGEDFAKLAREYSKSPSASQGGDVGWSSKDALTPEYAEVAFSLPVGGVKMIRMQQGYRILKVTDRKKEGLSTLEESEASLLEFLKNEKANSEIAKLINRLRDQSEIDILIPAGVPLNP